MKTIKTIVIVFLLTLMLCGGSLYVPDYTKMIDNQAVDGLTGVANSLAYSVEVIRTHNHSNERWLGISADQSGNDWALDTLTPFVAISGSNTYGGDADDEALILGTDDTPIEPNNVKFDLHRILIVAVEHGTPYKLRIVFGSGTMDQAVTAKTYTEVVVQFDVTNPQLSAGVPVEVQMPRCVSGTNKIWIQAWNATNDSEIDFLVGVHEYEG